MTKTKMYKYIGYNGTITSPVLLPNIDHLAMLEIKADGGKYLTDGNRKVYIITIPQDELSNWTEEILVIDK